ncbi:MAG TPA: penicillin acylase family protein [Streptosporangiaceae bacterium]|nr:penicillin acylase family protein [Streptosporangiaceae bacterium]
MPDEPGHEVADAGRAAAPRLWRRLGSAFAALVCCVLLAALLGSGIGAVPALGRALDPGSGVWTAAAGSVLPHSEALAIPGLRGRAAVRFTAAGIASVSAASDWDLFVALGYVEARFRLTELDLSRRLGEGDLAALAGRAAVGSDRFELRLGLLRTAQAEWASTPRSSPAGRALIAYARGVNDLISQDRANHSWPALFTLSGVYPGPWTPVDSLAIQGTLAQELSFTTTPLDYALLERSLGARRTMQWFPVQPPGRQAPYDPGPYRYRGIAPIAAQAGDLAPAGRALSATLPLKPLTPVMPRSRRTAAGAVSPAAAAAILRAVRRLPDTEIHRASDSNAWAANGTAVAGGGAMLAGDPHLPTTLPPVWYEVALRAPGMDVTGVTVPGLPAVLIGHNAHISWSLTDVQNQATIFYQERTSPRHPGQYFWRGSWRPVKLVRYAIKVRGGPAVRLTVPLTVHGPVLTEDGQTMSVYWTGNIPSPDLAAMLAVGGAASFAQFRSALRTWRAPSQTFVYADDSGNIGAISAGYFPLTARGNPWLPLPGTGAFDVVGTIPYSAVPQEYDPPGHVLATANQRPVSASYPYYIGTSADSYDPGFRADELYGYLRAHSSMAEADFAALQHDVTDELAATVVPRLLAALRGGQYSAAQQGAIKLLNRWNYAMTASSAAAGLWWQFWTDYLVAVFRPWWTAAKVPVGKDPDLVISPLLPLSPDLARWTVADQDNRAFTPPGGPARTAATVMRLAFTKAVADLARALGGSPASWSWGRRHHRVYPSLTQAPALRIGPIPGDGDPWTIDAASGGLTSAAGPSWRMIVRWPGQGSVSAEGIYPGGQDENPASPWYQDLFPDWRAGQYLPLPSAGPRAATAGITWKMGP